jgi:hypothetical protein
MLLLSARETYVEFRVVEKRLKIITYVYHPSDLFPRQEKELDTRSEWE